MISARGRAARAGVTLLAVGALALGPAATASAQTQPKTYEGGHFTTHYAPFSPTRTENQHKIWFHDGAWWALMLDATAPTERVHELMPDHTWRATATVVSTNTTAVGDAVQYGDTVHVAERGAGGAAYYVRLVFDPATRQYAVVTRTAIPVHPSAAPLSVVQDTTGELWVAWTTATNVVITHSYDGGHTWSRTLMLASSGDGKMQEASALVAYDGRIGILWSNQAQGAFQFASHHDGDYPWIWSHETALSGPDAADNHISLVRLRLPGQSSDTLAAAVKTSMTDHGQVSTAPVVELLVRTPAGKWSVIPVATVADQWDDPVLQVDQATQTLHVFASRLGAIVTKTAPLSDIRFPAGAGSLFVDGIGANLYDPTVTADPVTAQSGLVVLASDNANKAYRHAEMSLGGPVPVSPAVDKTPPGVPPNLAARAVSPDRAVVSWSPATDGNSWVPAGNGVPVSKYLLLRNGTQIATLGSTSYEDQPRAGGDTANPTSVRYQVVAVDAAGNKSPASSVVVELPAAPSNRTEMLIGLGLLGLAGLAAAGVLSRWWLRHLVSTRDHLPPARATGGPPSDESPDRPAVELSSHR